MRNERGFGLVELLVTVLLTGVVVLGLGSLYIATTRAFGESNSQAALQRQGTLVLEELGRRVRSATAVTTTTCNTHAISLNATASGGGSHCYYVGSNGELCQYDGTTCRNLLTGSLRPHVPGSQAVLTATSITANIPVTNQANVAFTITDGLNNSMTFNTSLTCIGRGCQ